MSSLNSTTSAVDTTTASPSPSPSQLLSEPNNASLYNRLSPIYDLLSSSEQPFRSLGIQLLQLTPAERVLEIGCGTGADLLDLAKRVGLEGKVVGLDVSEGMLQQARNKIAKEGLEKTVEVVWGDARRLSEVIVETREFDAAFAAFTLELLAPSDRRLVLSHIANLLKPHARLVAVYMSTTRPAQKRSWMSSIYETMNAWFPKLVDCKPIDLASELEGCGAWTIERKEEGTMWGLPVGIVVARLRR